VCSATNISARSSGVLVAEIKRSDSSCVKKSFEGAGTAMVGSSGMRSSAPRRDPALDRSAIMRSITSLLISSRGNASSAGCR